MRTVLAAVCCSIMALGMADAAPMVLEDFESLDGWRVAMKPAELVAAETSAVGQGAIQVKMPGRLEKRLDLEKLAPGAAWDRYEGISFWVKGNGSYDFGCIAVGGYGSNSSYTYSYYFPLRDTSWHQVTAGWYDMVSENSVDYIGARGSLPPSGIEVLHIGTRWTKWHNNAAMPDTSFCVDEVALVEDAPEPGPGPRPRPLSEVLRRLRDKQPVRIVCIGDSITAGTALEKPDDERYAVVLGQLLRERIGYDDISVVSRAVGGAKITDARAWVPRDFPRMPPHLITILYGYNDKSRTQTARYFRQSLSDYLDRLARATGGRSAILLLPTIPGKGPRFDMMDDFADVYRQVADDRGLAHFDLDKRLKALGREPYGELLADLAHPNAEGHRLIAELLCDFLATSPSD